MGLSIHDPRWAAPGTSISTFCRDPFDLGAIDSSDVDRKLPRLNVQIVDRNQPPDFGDPITVRRSMPVATVARMLDCDTSHVRRLVNSGALEAHRVGKRGLRIFLDLTDILSQR